MKDAVATMGTILPDDVGGRDAVHVAVIAVTAGERLHPGEHVDKSGFAANKEAVGIVDPFLKVAVVEPGQRFWLYLYPRTITSLHHSWTHPAFPSAVIDRETRKAQSELWLRRWIKGTDCPSYDLLIAASLGTSRVECDEYDEPVTLRMDDEYLTVVGWDAHGNIPDEVWDHVEVVTGQKVRFRPKYFTCSC